jgi:hypothetical protein
MTTKTQTQAIARLQEVAAIHNFEVMYSYKDPSGSGIATGKQVIPATSKDGAKNSFIMRWKYRDNTAKGPVHIVRVTDKGPRKPKV